MKNLFKLSLITGLLIVGSYQLKALQASVTVPVAGFTNLVSTFNNAPIKVTQIIVVSTTSTNTYGLLIDTPTNALTYLTPAYSNTVYYVTNYVSNLTNQYAYLAQWTNYYGVVSSINTNLSTAGTLVTNLVQIDAVNVVSAATNNYPARVGVGAAGNNTAVFTGVNYYFQNGCWFTNQSSGIAQITVIYQE